MATGVERNPSARVCSEHRIQLVVTHDNIHYNISSEIIKCPDLDDPPYGSVNQTGNKPGSTAHYECDYGFKLVGEEYRECLKTGYWSDDEPICKST